MLTKDRPFALGKLPAEHLERLLAQFPVSDPRVLVGPRVGEDAAVIDMGDRLLVAKSDPITFATDAIGWYAVHVNANDIVCTGAEPRWYLCTLLLPGKRADEEMVDEIFRQISAACDEVGATLIGGHTEITHGIYRPIVVGSMLGEVERGQLVTTGGAVPGDAVLLTQRLAVEATAIIARERRDELMQRPDFDPDYLDRCADFIYRPGISVVAAARHALGAARIHAMHDPTEGGLATGLWELAAAADVGLEIEAESVPIYDETQRLCDLYGLDPWGVIASGSLLLTLDAADAPAVCRVLREARIDVTVIGRVRTKEHGTILQMGREDDERTVAQPPTKPLPSFSRDEIARLFD
jgi:hydrogenase expression/formation protein HypE